MQPIPVPEGCCIATSNTRMPCTNSYDPHCLQPLPCGVSDAHTAAAGLGRKRDDTGRAVHEKRGSASRSVPSYVPDTRRDGTDRACGATRRSTNAREQCGRAGTNLSYCPRTALCGVWYHSSKRCAVSGTVVVRATTGCPVLTYDLRRLEGGGAWGAKEDLVIRVKRRVGSTALPEVTSTICLRAHYSTDMMNSAICLPPVRQCPVLM